MKFNYRVIINYTQSSRDTRLRARTPRRGSSTVFGIGLVLFSRILGARGDFSVGADKRQAGAISISALAAQGRGLIMASPIAGYIRGDRQHYHPPPVFAPFIFASRDDVQYR